MNVVTPRMHTNTAVAAARKSVGTILSLPGNRSAPTSIPLEATADHKPAWPDAYSLSLRRTLTPSAPATIEERERETEIEIEKD